ncbi:mCG146221, partial [Mus musculus]
RALAPGKYSMNVGKGRSIQRSKMWMSRQRRRVATGKHAHSSILHFLLTQSHECILWTMTKIFVFFSNLTRLQQNAFTLQMHTMLSILL